MKIEKTTSIAVLIASLVIFSLGLVSAIGITYPHPQDIELQKGESSSFVFQIQAQDFAIRCIPTIEESQGLEITLEKEYIVSANERLNVKGTVKLPSDMSLGDYKATFCIECSPSELSGGSTVKTRTCSLPVTVAGVDKRTRKNAFDVEKAMTLLWVILVIAILILILLIWYLIKKRR
jgi:hypothetical protein